MFFIRGYYTKSIGEWTFEDESQLVIWSQPRRAQSSLNPLPRVGFPAGAGVAAAGDPDGFSQVEDEDAVVV